VIGFTTTLMKDKRYKYLEDVIEEYIELTDEQIEVPLLTGKAREKYEALKFEKNGTIIAYDDAGMHLNFSAT
jgi:hypothetical protein